MLFARVIKSFFFDKRASLKIVIFNRKNVTKTVFRLKIMKFVEKLKRSAFGF